MTEGIIVAIIGACGAIVAAFIGIFAKKRIDEKRKETADAKNQLVEIHGKQNDVEQNTISDSFLQSARIVGNSNRVRQNRNGRQ